MSKGKQRKKMKEKEDSRSRDETDRQYKNTQIPEQEHYITMQLGLVKSCCLNLFTKPLPDNCSQIHS